MKIIRIVAVLGVVAASVVLLPQLQALPYWGLQMPPEPPAPPTPPAPPAPPAAPASMDVLAELPELPELPEPPEPPSPADHWYHDGDQYVLSVGDMNVVNSDGDTDIEDLRHAYGRQFFWFRHDGRAYVVRDAATIHALIELYRPQTDLGREQGELGRKQGALGRKQGDLGRRQGELGREQGRLGLEQARLAMRFDDDDDPAVRARRRDADRRQRELSRKQEILGREQSELGREQAKLGAEQSKLGDRQSELSREIEHKLTPMIEDMIRKGVAEKAH